MTESLLLFFLISSLIIILAPGQDMLLVVTRSISRGPKAGAITAAGISTGLLGHTLLTALGLGALLQASELLFTLMKYAGGAYLIYLGIRTFRADPVTLGHSQDGAGSLRTLFIQGVMSNLSNPKIAIFYFAFLPQFITAETSHPTLTLLALGSAFALLTFILKAPIGYLAGRLSGTLQSRPAIQRWLNRASGSVLMALGFSLALDSEKAV